MYDAIIDTQRAIHSSSVAAVFPFVRTFVMDKGGIMLGENKINHFPFIFNIWERGELYQNSNGMIIGKSGSGKSVTIKTIMARSAVLMGIESLVLDAEGEYVVVAESLCGFNVTISPTSDKVINIFDIDAEVVKDEIYNKLKERLN